MSAAYFGLGVVAHGTFLCDRFAFDRVARLMDSSAAGVWSEVLLGYLLIVGASVLEQRERLPSSDDFSWYRRAALPLSVGALAAWTYYATTLRMPWLNGSAESTSRVALWSRTLSATVSGIPVVAFLEVLALAAVITHSSTNLLRVLYDRGSISTTGRVQAWRTAVLLVSLLVVSLGSAVLIGMATGAPLAQIE